MYILKFESEMDEEKRITKYVTDISYAKLDDPDLSRAFIKIEKLKRLTLNFEGPREPFAAKLLALTQVYKWIMENHDKEATFCDLLIHTVFFIPNRAVIGYLRPGK